MVSFALYNLKGGVGKTAASINLAYLAASEGYKTLVWDLDPQGSASFLLGASSALKNESKKILNLDLPIINAVQASIYENLYIIPADLSARNVDIFLNETTQSKKRVLKLIESLKKEFDVIILDCAPGISLIHDNIFLGVDWVLMPNIPTTLSIRSYDTIINYFKDNKLEEEKIKCFFSMVDHRKNLHHATMQSFYKSKVFFKNYIPYLSDVEKMGEHEAPLETFASNSFAAQCYTDLWKEIKKSCMQ